MPKPISRFLGIDPGKTGGLAVITIKGKIVHWHQMPITSLDLWSHLLFIREKFNIQSCSIERVNSRPGEGHMGAFTFGRGFGNLEMAITALGIPYKEVHPRTWVSKLGIQPKKKNETKGQFKDRLRAKAQRTFPDLELWSRPKSLGVQRSVCDAMLIADFERKSNA